MQNGLARSLISCQVTKFIQNGILKVGSIGLEHAKSPV
jgi:hypothetical protein